MLVVTALGSQAKRLERLTDQVPRRLRRRDEQRLGIRSTVAAASAPRRERRPAPAPQAGPFSMPRTLLEVQHDRLPAEARRLDLQNTCAAPAAGATSAAPAAGAAVLAGVVAKFAPAFRASAFRSRRGRR